ncbi:MAG TPA: caspase family protein [Kofleriaceae bacterium]|nr:caspase family protein [Kofleriaceae bacterium]
MTRRWSIALCLLVALVPRRSNAGVERYALIVGNNAGDADEPTLHYAEDDAQRFHDVMRELGGFRPENVVMLRGEHADTVQRALISLNERIRTHTADGAQSELLVYYSGHADQAALHLGRTPLELAQLEQLVRGSAATLRVLILDSCRSGALTRVKGGTIVPGFVVSLDQRLSSDGVVFWTASSASEDAQESDLLRGSFFTHYLVSGLLGAADLDGDGKVTLVEAYQYAYENTLRATSRTLGGTQHPTFHYELDGKDQMVLTVLGRRDNQRALVGFPEGKSYLLIRNNADGAVVAELGSHDRARQLSVKPGRYFVRGRGPDFLLEGMLELKPAEHHQLREQELERIEYARLVRKGGAERSHASSVQAGYAIRMPLWSGAGVCQGAFVGYAVDLRVVSITPRVGACRGSFDNPFLHGRTDELDLALRGTHTWDIGHTAIHLGVSLGGSLLHQDFSAPALAPARTAPAAHLGVLVGAPRDVMQGFYSGVELDALTYFFNQRATGTDMVQVRNRFAVRLDVILLGKHW